MENQKKQDFTRRLSQCNQGGMIIIIYDIFFAYIDDVRKAKETENDSDYKTGLRKAQETLDELIHALNFKYEIAGTLYPLYMYCKNLLAKAMYEHRLEKVDEAENIMRRLYSSFEEAAKQDTSGPIMSNAQQVYAGMTYGKFDLNEDYTDNTHRGFLV